MDSGNLVLHETDYQRIHAILERTQKDLRAHLVMLIDRSGHQIACEGPDQEIDQTALASLAAANLAATDGLAHLVGETGFSALAHQGRHRSLHISGLLKQFSLVLLFDASASLGRVRWKVKLASAMLEDVFQDFQRRMEKGGHSADSFQDRSFSPHFSDEELEELLGP